MEKNIPHNRFIFSGIVCMALMLACLIGFIMNAAIGDNINTSVTSNDKIWNKGVIHMNYETHTNGIWKLDFKSASDGFIKESKLKIENASVQKLYADIHCNSIPDNAALTLWIVQENSTVSVDVTNLNTPLEYSLDDFINGEVRVRLQISGVEDVTSEIYIK